VHEEVTAHTAVRIRTSSALHKGGCVIFLTLEDVMPPLPPNMRFDQAAESGVSPPGTVLPDDSGRPVARRIPRAITGLIRRRLGSAGSPSSAT